MLLKDKINYTKLNILMSLNKYKYFAILACLIIFSLYSAIEVKYSIDNAKYSFNTLNVLLHAFALYSNIFLVVTPIYIYIITNAIKNTNLDNYVVIRTNKIKWIENRIFTLAIYTFIYLIISFFIVVIISTFFVPWGFSWTTGVTSGFTSYFNKNFVSLNPITVLFIIFIFLSLYTLSLVISLISLLFKTNFLSLCIGFIINFLILVLYKFDYTLEKFWFLPYKHIFLNFRSTQTSINNIYSVKFSILYWSSFILIAILLNLIVIEKKDLIFEVKNEI